MKILKKLLVLFLCLILAACATSAKSADELKAYVKNKYNNPEIISIEESTEKTIGYFRDKKYGFEFFVASILGDISIDGSSFGHSVNTRTDFIEQLTPYFENDFKKAIKESKIPVNVQSYCVLEFETKKDYNKYIEEIVEIYKETDVYNQFVNEINIIIDGERTGSYALYKDKFQDVGEEKRKPYLLALANITDEPMHENFKYLRTEFCKLSDYNIEDDIEAWGKWSNYDFEQDACKYYYEYLGDEVWVLDAYHHYNSHYYTSYDAGETPLRQRNKLMRIIDYFFN